MKRPVVLALFLCGVPLWAQDTPVNPHASPEARALLHYLYTISGRYILTGQHNYPNTIANWTDRAYDLTGKYPAVFGQDFGFQGGADKDSVLARPALVEEAMRQWKNGAIVTFTWHAVRPTDDEPVTFKDSVQAHLSDFEWHELLTPGTDLYNRWCAQVDVIAGYLKQLRDARVPVLWRPYHEVNGNWFWWGGRKGSGGSAALYRQLFDRLVKVHHLDNLVWVWNANAPGNGNSGPGPYTDYFPGNEYADVLSVDVYGEFKQSFYQKLLDLAAGKPIALGEVGPIPGPVVLKEQPKYTWFMCWSEFVELNNPLDAVRAGYNDARALHRDDPRVSEPMAGIRKAAAPPVPQLVMAEPLPAAKELLVRLHAARGKGILAGQQVDAASPADGAGHVFSAAGKYPAVYVAELAGPNAKAVVAEARSQHAAHSLVELTWRPDLPNGEPAGKLYEFEWKELLKPGTHLYERWAAQVDAAAACLLELQEAGIPVLWHPYPDANGNRYWWAGRKPYTAALYRQLFERLVITAQLHNLAWVWSALPSGFGPDGPGPLADYFPGLNYADALVLNGGRSSSAWRGDAEFARFAVGKAIGIEMDGWLPNAEQLSQSTGWSWFVASGNSQDDALRLVYENEHVIAR